MLFALSFAAAAFCVVIASCNDVLIPGEGDSDKSFASGEEETEYKDLMSASDDPGAGADVTTPITYSGTVVDPRDGDNAVVADAQVQVTFADGTDAGYSVIYTDEDGKFEFVGDEDYDYKVTVEKAQYITTELWTKRSVCGDLEGTLPTVWLIPQPVVTKGAIAGIISDAFTSFPIAQANIEFRAGLNAPEEDPVLFTGTSSNNMPLGKYELDSMEAGVYTGYISKTGSDYVPSTLLAYVLGGRTISGQHGVMTTELQQNQMRIVLTWGGIPTDLDSHLWAPCPYAHGDCENGYFHLDFVTNGAGSNPFMPYFDLDVDDTSSYGPETTTVYDATPTPGEVYSFLVHDYSNLSCTSNCLAMCNSANHKVDVYAGECVQSFYPTQGTDATVWHVFDAVFSGSEWTITSVDDYCHQSDVSSVGPTCY